ncbi:MAG TPA: SpoIIE family protein phosphatase [Catalimonadaceae bacterium]|jgi:sigma-B regulation protein RsbU (phosphoserine phosphatase)|nr:SpoIIE family protein phosphatase [Catalimonadaceae bacterium]
MDRLYFLLGLGLKPDDDFLERRKVQVSNFIIQFIIGLNLVNALIYGFYYFQPVMLADAISSFLIGILALILHYKGFRKLVRHMVLLGSLFSIMNLGLHFGDTIGQHYYLLFISIISFLIFDSWWLIFGYSLLGISGFLSIDAWYAFHPLTPDPNLSFGQYPNVALSFSMILFAIFIFKREATDYQKIVEIQNKDLSNLSVKLMFQKDEALIASNQLKRKSRILEQQNQSIVDSLRLASLLQKESLPHEDSLFSGLKAGVLVYKAMQMVSGDFYWGKSTFQGQILVVADCIGHGVPGGMMALLSGNLISQIVEEHGKTFPSDILAELDSRLRRRIKHDVHSEIGDGMDIAIVLIKDKQVSFASASRPLLRISKNGESELISGTRFQLASGKHNQMDFETVEIEAKSGDRFFLYTDGITDQFSSNTGKKLGTKRLVEELSALQHLPLNKQKAEIEAFLENWQDKEKQTDDMLLIGFEIA